MNKMLKCDECKGQIFPWNEVYRRRDGSWVCGDCFEAFLSELSIREAAEYMGCEVRFAEEL